MLRFNIAFLFLSIFTLKIFAYSFLPQKRSCSIPHIITEIQKECQNKKGLFHVENFVIQDTYECRAFRTCLLPIPKEEVVDVNQCIKVEHSDPEYNDKYFCSLLYTDVPIPEEYSFLESTKVLNAFYEYLKVIYPEPRLPEIDYKDSCDFLYMPSEKEHECISNGGYYYEDNLRLKNTGNCKNFSTCFLPTPKEEIQDINQCVKFRHPMAEDNIYCSILFNDVPIPKDYPFLQTVEALDKFYSFLRYIPVNSTPKIYPTLPEIDNGSYCGMNAMVTKRQQECIQKGGYYYENAYKIKDQSKCQNFGVCLLASSPEDIEDITQCVRINHPATINKIYCSFLYNDIPVPEDYSFIETVEAIDEFYGIFDYIPIRAPRPSTTTTTTTTTSTKTIITSSVQNTSSINSEVSTTSGTTQTVKTLPPLSYRDYIFALTTTTTTKTLPITTTPIPFSRDYIFFGLYTTTTTPISTKTIPTIYSDSPNTTTVRNISSSTKTVPTSSKIILSSTKTVPTSTKIILSSTKTVPTSTKIILSSTKTVPTSTKIILSSTKTIPTSTKIILSSTKTIPTSTKIILSSTKTVPTSSKIILSSTKTVPTSTKIILSSTKTVPTSTKIILSSTKTVPTSSKIIPISTKTVPLPSKCTPTTVKVTVKETVTVTMTVTAQSSGTTIGGDDSQCGNKWDQCGGQGFTGPTCCKSGSVCHEYNQHYSQCI